MKVIVPRLEVFLKDIRELNDGLKLLIKNLGFVQMVWLGYHKRLL